MEGVRSGVPDLVGIATTIWVGNRGRWGPKCRARRAMLSRDKYERTDYTRVDVADGIQLRAIKARALTAATTTKKMPGLVDTVFA